MTTQHDRRAIARKQINRFTLAEVYAMARRGEDVDDITPAEFATMTQTEREDHLRALERIAREVASDQTAGGM